MKNVLNTYNELSIKLGITLMLLGAGMSSFAQSNNQGTDRSSHAEQANGYLHNIENDPNGVPNSSAWYSQPWIWAIVAAIVILIIGFIAKGGGSRSMEGDVENGLRN